MDIRAIWMRAVVPLLVVVCVCETAQAQGDLDPSPADQIESILVEEKFGGVALVVRDGEVIYEKAHDYADWSNKVLNTIDTRFSIGSVTKQFTAALVLMLMEDGLLDLHEPISTYLPDDFYPPAGEITSHHLLTHTSGVPSYSADVPDWPAEATQPHTPAQLLARIKDLPLEFEPGTDWDYSNSGFLLLGLIIEQLTGTSYEEAFRERIGVPFGLHDTGIMTLETEGMAVGHETPNRGSTTYARPPFVFHPSTGYASGGVYSTVRDLLRWDQLIYADSVFDLQETTALWTTAHAQQSGRTRFAYSYGYGWAVEDVYYYPMPREAHAVWHSGRRPGYNAVFYRLPDERSTIILLRNVGPDILNFSLHNLIIPLLVQDTETAVEAAGRSMASELALGQNYPNPFNARTTIRVRIPRADAVSVRIYDVMGREVAQLINGRASPGGYELTWDGTDDAGRSLPAGVYICRLKTGSIVETRIMTLSR